RVHVQVAVHRARRTDADRLVGLRDVECVLVGARVDGDGLQPELTARAHDAERDLPAVGDEDLVQRRRGQLGSSALMSCPASTSSSFSTRKRATTPSASLRISWNVFMISISPTTSPAAIVSPSSTNGSASGDGRR